MKQQRPLSDLIYGECGAHDQYISYVQKSYVKRYKGSYVFSDKWLNIAKEAYLYGIKEHGGNIYPESDGYSYTKFTIELPKRGLYVK